MWLTLLLLSSLSTAAKRADFVVPVRDIPIGTVLRAEDLDVSRREILDESVQRVSVEEIVGQTTSARLLSGEALRSERLVSSDQGIAALVPPGQRAATVEVTSSVDVPAGAYVDVLFTVVHEGEPVTVTVTQHARVLQVGPGSVTLVMSPKQAMMLSLPGKIAVAPRHPYDVSDPEPLPAPQSTASASSGILVATRALPPGHLIGEDDVAVVKGRGWSGLGSEALPSLLGKPVAEPLLAGEPVREERLADDTRGVHVRMPRGMVLLNIPVGGTSGVVDGSYVDVNVELGDGVYPLLKSARVIETHEQSLTVAVTPWTAEHVVHGMHVGQGFSFGIVPFP